MNKLKLVTLTLMTALLLQGASFAAGVGYINYKKVYDNYPEAKAATKTIDAKALELQQYLVDKEKEFKSLETPLKKQKFEEKVAKEFKVKEEAYLKMKVQKEEEIYKKIQDAAQAVLVDQKLDAVIDFRVIFVGGIDITDLVIQKLRGK